MNQLCGQPINYQGRLTDADGELVNATVNISLKVYDSETGGSVLYSEEVGEVVVLLEGEEATDAADVVQPIEGREGLTLGHGQVLVDPGDSAERGQIVEQQVVEDAHAQPDTAERFQPRQVNEHGVGVDEQVAGDGGEAAQSLQVAQGAVVDDLQIAAEGADG